MVFLRKHNSQNRKILNLLRKNNFSIPEECISGKKNKKKTFLKKKRDKNLKLMSKAHLAFNSLNQNWFSSTKIKHILLLWNFHSGKVLESNNETRNPKNII